MKTQMQTVTGKLNIIERLKSSTNGNPRYSFVLVDSEGNLSELVKTCVDCSYGYAINNYQNKVLTVEVKHVRGVLSLINIVK